MSIECVLILSSVSRVHACSFACSLTLSRIESRKRVPLSKRAPKSQDVLAVAADLENSFSAWSGNVPASAVELLKSTLGMGTTRSKAERVFTSALSCAGISGTPALAASLFDDYVEFVELF